MSVGVVGMASWQMSTWMLVFRLLGVRRAHESAANFDALVQRLERRPQRPDPPRRLSRTLDMRVDRSSGWPVYWARPPGTSPATHLVYLHGGSYVVQMGRGDWVLLDKCAHAVPATCVAPIYPLAPRHTAETTVAQAADVLAGIMDEAGDGNTVLVGTSAGGGIALAAAQLLRDRGRAPARLILISPGVLDGTLSDPRQDALEPRDRMVARGGLAEAVRLYAGSLDVRDPRVSPLFGDMHGLPPMTVLVSNSELLYPDSLRLAEKARKAGVPVDLHVGDDLPHAYAVFVNTPEGKKALATIISAARDPTRTAPTT